MEDNPLRREEEDIIEELTYVAIYILSHIALVYLIYQPIDKNLLELVLFLGKPSIYKN